MRAPARAANGARCRSSPGRRHAAPRPQDGPNAAKADQRPRPSGAAPPNSSPPAGPERACQRTSGERAKEGSHRLRRVGRRRRRRRTGKAVRREHQSRATDAALAAVFPGPISPPCENMTKAEHGDESRTKLRRMPGSGAVWLSPADITLGSSRPSASELPPWPPTLGAESRPLLAAACRGALGAGTGHRSGGGAAPLAGVPRRPSPTSGPLLKIALPRCRAIDPRRDRGNAARARSREKRHRRAQAIRPLALPRPSSVRACTIARLRPPGPTARRSRRPRRTRQRDRSNRSRCPPAAPQHR